MTHRSVVSFNADRVDVPDNVWLEISEVTKGDQEYYGPDADPRDARTLIRSDEVDRRMYSMLDTEIDYSDLDREKETSRQIRWKVYKALRELKQLEKDRGDRVKEAIEDAVRIVR